MRLGNAWACRTGLGSDLNRGNTFNGASCFTLDEESAPRQFRSFSGSRNTVIPTRTLARNAVEAENTFTDSTGTLL